MRGRRCNMRVSVDVKQKSKIKNVTSQYEKQAQRAVFLGCSKIQEVAVTEILRGAKSGQIYSRGGKSHQASAAGEYPASDTGNLASNINVQIQTGGLSGIVESKANYSSYLEFGTSRMAARPFMFPSAERARAFIRKKFRELRAR